MEYALLLYVRNSALSPHKGWPGEDRACNLPPGGRKEMQRCAYRGWPIAPSFTRPNAGGGGGLRCGISANEYSCAHHVTWSPNNFGDLTPYLTYASHLADNYSATPYPLSLRFFYIKSSSSMLRSFDAHFWSNGAGINAPKLLFFLSVIISCECCVRVRYILFIFLIFCTALSIL